MPSAGCGKMTGKPTSANAIVGERVRAPLHRTDAGAVTRTPCANFRSSVFSAVTEIERARCNPTDVRQLD
jgi:hypothetical protein